MGLRHLLFFAIFPFVIIQILRRPHFGLLVFAALALVRIHEIFWGFEPFRMVLVVSIATLLAFLFKNAEYEGPTLSKSPILLLFTGFLTLIALSAAFALGPGGVDVAYARVGKFAKMLLFMLLMQRMLDDWKKVDQFLLVWILGATFLAVWGTEQHFRGNLRLEFVGGGDTNGSNELGALFVLVFPIILQLALAHSEGWKKWLYFGLVPLFVAAIAFTGSRSAFLGLIVAAGLVFVLSPQRKRMVRIALPLTPLIAILSIAYFAQRVEQIETYEQDWSAMSRLWFWSAALNMVAANPAMGVGPANYPLVCAQFGSPEAGRDCHSTYFSMIAEVGIPTFVIWMAALVLAVIVFERLRKIPGEGPIHDKIRMAAVGLEAGYLAFLFNGLFHTFGYFEYLYWPIVLGIGLLDYAQNRLPLVEGAAVQPEDERDPDPERPRSHEMVGGVV